MQWEEFCSERLTYQVWQALVVLVLKIKYYIWSHVICDVRYAQFVTILCFLLCWLDKDVHGVWSDHQLLIDSHDMHLCVDYMHRRFIFYINDCFLTRHEEKNLYNISWLINIYVVLVISTLEYILTLRYSEDDCIV